MKTTFIVFSVIIIVFAINLRITPVVGYDLIRNLGRVKIALFRIPLFDVEISFVGKYFKLIGKRKVKQIKINFSNKNLKLIENLFAYFKKKIYLIELGSDFVISTENAYLASILSGNVKAISGIVTAHISAQRPEAKIESNVATGFCENMLYFEVKVDLFICLFDLIWAFFKALFTRSTYV